MTRDFVPGRLDVAAFAEAGSELSGGDALENFPRLSAEMEVPITERKVEWRAIGANRDGAGGAPVPWLHIAARCHANLVCQRCLGPLDIDLHVDRWFRFAADEATAAMDDETSEEDVLAVTRDFDLRTLVEDELLMEIPVVPRHEVCPQPVRLSVADAEFDAAEDARPNHFAALDALRTRKPEGS